jgi:hypothetical protein
MKKILFTFIFISSLSPLLSSAQESCTNSGCITYEGKQYCELESKLLLLGGVTTCPDADKDGVPGCSIYDPYNAVSGYCSGTCTTAGGMTCYQVSNINLSSYPDCNDNNANIKGSGYFTVSATYDDSYVQDTILRRKFDPRQERSITPIDDIKIKISKPCGAFNDPVPTKIYIVSGTESILVADTKLSKASDGTLSYTLRGFPMGWIPASVGGLERLTNQMAQGNAVKIKVVTQQSILKGPELTSSELVERSAEYTVIQPKSGLCARVFGKGEQRIIHMIGAESATDKVDFTYLVENSLNFAAHMSAVFDPFRKYWDKFSYSVDLKKHDESQLKTDGQDSVKKSLPIIRKVSSCGRGARMYFHFSNSVYGGGLSWILAKVALIELPVSSDGFEGKPSVLLHEMGHGYAGLSDEYLYFKYVNNEPVEDKYGVLKLIGRNCELPKTTPPMLSSIFSYNGVSYASPHIGCSTPDRYRPSETSIMNDTKIESEKFNVVSCGYIIAAIKGGNPKSYWSECVNLDTIPITN